MGTARWLDRIGVSLGEFAVQSYLRPWRALAITAVASCLGLFFARNLSLNANMVELLPKHFESVKGIAELDRRFGGIGWIVVVGEGASPDRLERFADELAPKLAALPDVKFVEHRRPNRFFEERALYFLEEDELESLKERLESLVGGETMKRNPLFVPLEDERPQSLALGDLAGSIDAQAMKRFSTGDSDHYFDQAKRRIVLLIRPKGSSADLGYNRRVIGEVEAFLSRQDFSALGPGFRWATTGTFKKKVDQQNQITSDIATSSLLALLVLVLYLAVHFRNAAAVVLALTPVIVGLTWVYGFVGLAYGNVNLLTGFLGAILGGLGTEHSIHLIGRYVGLRCRGLRPDDATRETFATTGRAAFISAAVASLTFLSLAISDFKAFREFGVIAGAGMMLVFFAFVVALPASFGVAAAWGWRPENHPEVQGARSELAFALPRWRWPVATLATVVGAVLIMNMGAVRFDYDFAALENQQLASFQLDRKVNAILGRSQTPVVVLTDNREDERAVVAELRRRKADLGPRSTIDFAASLDDLVPADQISKRRILDQARGVMKAVDRAKVGAEHRKDLERLDRLLEAQPFTRAELPEGMRRQLQGESNGESGFVLVFPAVSLSHGRKVLELAREVRGIELPSGKTISAAGEPMVLADVLGMVMSDGPLILVSAILAVLLAMALTLGSLRNALLCMMPTTVSLLALMGLMPLAGVPFNYLNICVVPVLVGTTVDAGVHLLERLGGERDGFPRIYGETGRSIAGGLLTSAVGFGAMMMAGHPGLRSVGMVANLGFAVNLLFMLLGFPAALLVTGNGWRRLPFRGRDVQPIAPVSAPAARSGEHTVS